MVPLDLDGVREAARAMLRDGVEAVAIGFLSAYAHPRHERAARDILATMLPESVTICLSSEVCPEMREYERFSTTAANAYVRPLMSGYLARLDQALRQSGLACPLLLMMSGGGLTTLDNARRFPVRLVESGPAGGAVLASHVAAECGLGAVLAFDMGGTTAKICLIDDGVPERARRFEVARMYRDQKGSGLPVRIPVIELVEIGAGGGSIARVDGLGRIAVGPDSAGAEPGPVCYGRGGIEPTVTDANVALGRIDPLNFAGGTIRLDAEASIAALARAIGGPLGLDGVWPAVGVCEIVEENMANAARVHAIERGRVVSRYTVIAFGGGAPLHAGRLAEKLGVDRIIVPAGAGVGSAIGFLRAPIAYEVVRSLRTLLSDFDFVAVNTMLAAMHGEARGVVSEAAADAELQETLVVDARYLGQGHELQVTLPGHVLTPADLIKIRSEFERQYRAMYGLVLADAEVELVTFSAGVSTRVACPARAEPIAARIVPATATRQVYDSTLGDMAIFSSFWRPDLAAGDCVEGPAVIAEQQTTTIVPANFIAQVNTLGHLVLQRCAT
jgi:N-methylhydantoinase A